MRRILWVIGALFLAAVTAEVFLWNDCISKNDEQTCRDAMIP